MYRVSFITLIFSLLVLLLVSCDPGTSCPSGQIVVNNTCVENTCIDYPCDVNQHCVVDVQYGPDCACNQGTVASHDYSGAHPVLVCEVPSNNNNCSCTGSNTHCDSKGDCVCDEGFYGSMDYSGMHPVLNCEDPCLGYNCAPGQMCQVNEENNQYIPVCDYE